MPKDVRKIPLLFSFAGLSAAIALALWAGNHYMSNDASLFYGLIAGLSFGAAFAFGQQIKNHFVPPREPSTAWKNKIPTAADLRPGQKAMLKSRKISVEFDADSIWTMVNKLKRESINWNEIENINIQISDDALPVPQWLVVGRVGSDIKGLVVPNDAEGLDALQDAFKERLPGYDNDKTYQTVINAMSAMEGNFAVWSKTLT